MVSVCVAGDDGSVSPSDAAEEGVWDSVVDGAALAFDSRRVSIGGRVTTLIAPCSGWTVVCSSLARGDRPSSESAAVSMNEPTPGAECRFGDAASDARALRGGVRGPRSGESTLKTPARSAPA